MQQGPKFGWFHLCELELFCGGVSCTRSLIFFSSLFHPRLTLHSHLVSRVLFSFSFGRWEQNFHSLSVGRMENYRPFFNTQFFCAFFSLAVDEEKCGCERKKVEIVGRKSYEFSSNISHLGVEGEVLRPYFIIYEVGVRVESSFLSRLAQLSSGGKIY